MSLETWKKEFYPRAATAGRNTLAAVEHSLRKWEGALKKNLKRHGLDVTSNCLVDKTDPRDFNSHFFFDGRSCSLCQRFGNCQRCPIKEAGQCCLNEGTAYIAMIDDGNPIPMVRLLRKIRNEIVAEAAKIQ